ncbi:GNAT family N-acetyltransferase [Nocardia takedensis]|uniref:GNAT family N-acetyltransferase n=1 Tax=Nocardia takedensis TaxID=259390 RepID=UPI0012F666FF|nr:GNAT family N-acetyltransferase [Nocardia takedensis]
MRGYPETYGRLPVVPGPIDVMERDDAWVAPDAIEGLLRSLGECHRLTDSDFADPKWMVEPGRGNSLSHLVALDGQLPIGFLAGYPHVGHIALIGALRTSEGVGAALMDAFVARSVSAGALNLSVVLDTEVAHRWRRRTFFERIGFRSVDGSALHFRRPLPS